MIRRLRDSLLRLYVRTPEHPTKYRIVQWLGRNWFPDKGVVAVAHPDLRLRLNPRDWIEYLLLRNEEYEPMTLVFLAANLRPGDAAIFAGVNFGQHVAVAARAVGPTGLVIGLEPQPRALVKTWENLQLNGLSTPVRLVAAALGSRDELVPMAWADLGNTGAASLLDKTPGLFVQVVQLSRVLERFGSASYRLLLLDVQGFESNALAGLAGGPLPESGAGRR
jgi:FkbM family methyltransferase